MRGQLSPSDYPRPTDDAQQSQQVPPAEENAAGSILHVSGHHSKIEAYQMTLIFMARIDLKKQYRTYIGKWVSFCCKREINVFEADVNNVLSFLTVLYKSGLGCSCINTARSALSSFIQLNNFVNIGSHPLVRRFMRGVFVLRPSLPRYNVTWNVNIVLKYLKSLSPLSSLSLLQSSHKLVMLLALLSGNGD